MRQSCVSPDVSQDTSDQIRGYLVLHFLHLLFLPGADLVVFFGGRGPVVLVFKDKIIHVHFWSQQYCSFVLCHKLFRLIVMWTQMYRRHENNTVYSSQSICPNPYGALLTSMLKEQLVRCGCHTKRRVLEQLREGYHSVGNDYSYNYRINSKTIDPHTKTNVTENADFYRM